MTCDHPLDPDSDCVECQLSWAEMVDAMSRVGANVCVTLPDDVATWFDPAAFGATWIGDVVCVNGDSLDVMNADSDVEPVAIEYCRLNMPGVFNVWMKGPS